MPETTNTLPVLMEVRIQSALYAKNGGAVKVDPEVQAMCPDQIEAMIPDLIWATEASQTLDITPEIQAMSDERLNALLDAFVESEGDSCKETQRIIHDALRSSDPNNLVDRYTDLREPLALVHPDRPAQFPHGDVARFFAVIQPQSLVEHLLVEGRLSSVPDWPWVIPGPDLDRVDRVRSQRSSALMLEPEPPLVCAASRDLSP